MDDKITCLRVDSSNRAFTRAVSSWPVKDTNFFLGRSEWQGRDGMGSILRQPLRDVTEIAFQQLDQGRELIPRTRHGEESLFVQRVCEEGIPEKKLSDEGTVPRRRDLDFWIAFRTRLRSVAMFSEMNFA